MTTDPTSTASNLPRWQEFMHPVLTVMADGLVRRRREIYADVASHLQLSEAQLAERIKSGQRRADDRISWAMTDLTRAKLIETTTRGQYEITQAGRDLLATHRTLTIADLEQIPAYVEYVPSRQKSATAPSVDAPSAQDQSPEDLIDTGIQLIEDATKVALLERLRGTDPTFFEVVVRQVLVAMGYGSDGRMSRLHGSGDGGLDGVIDRDELGLSKIYIQAKRYAEDATIGRPKIQEFVGALATRGATVGVFFTTSRFTSEAHDAAERVQQDVALVDGIRLAELMIKHRVGVQVARTEYIVKVDEDFFAGE